MRGRLRAGASASAMLLCAATTLTACAPKLGLPTPDTRLPLAYEAKSGASAPSASQTLDRWWLLFDDAQLTGLVDQALLASPDVRTAMARLREARANRSQALFAYDPQGNLGASASEQYINSDLGGISGPGSAVVGSGGVSTGPIGGASLYSGEQRQYGAAFNVSWELDLFGRVGVARTAADADYAFAGYDFEATRISLAAQTATLLFQARGTAVQLGDARENATDAHALARTAAAKVAAGLAARNETARLDADAETADAEVARLLSVLANQQRQLLALVGQGTAPSASLPIEAAIAPAPVVPASTPGELLARRPDVRRAERQLASSAARLQLNKLALFPRLLLQPGVQLSRQETSYNFTSALWSIGMGLTVPVLDRPRLLAEIRAQTARGEQAAAQYERAVQVAYSEAEQALATVASDQVRVAALSRATERARFAYDAAAIGYRAGLTDLTTLLQAQQAWRAIRGQLTVVRTAALLNAVNAFRAFGGGWTPLTPPPVQTASR